MEEGEGREVLREKEIGGFHQLQGLLPTVESDLFLLVLLVLVLLHHHLVAMFDLVDPLPA